MKHMIDALPGNWRLLGEIELRVQDAIGDRIHPWLVETLHPLGLNERFLTKISTSIALAAIPHPAVQDEAALGHLHVLIYTPEDSPSSGQSWGFFRVERKGDLQSMEPNDDHAIVFYLYREGV